MKLQINGIEVDFELENEKTVADVLDSIGVWSAERNLICTEVFIDEEHYFVDCLPLINIENLKMLNCILQSKAEIVVSSIYEGINYCNRSIKYLEELLTESEFVLTGKDLIVGFNWLFQVIKMVTELSSLSLDDVQYKDKTINSFLMNSQNLVDNLADDLNVEIKDVKNCIQCFIEINECLKLILMRPELAQMIVKSIDSPDIIIQSIKDIKNELPDQLENLSLAAESFQTGQDGDGVEKIQKFIDFIYKYLRSCYQLTPLFSINLADIKVGEDSLEEKNATLHDMLNSVIEILENEDMIGLADSLEYEIKELLEDLDSYLVAILEKLNK